MRIHTSTRVRCNHDGVIDRRSFLQWSGLGIAAGATLGFGETMALRSEEMRKNSMACILLFMNGGPSQLETFDPKPGHENGGQTRAIDTAASGIKIAELWPNV